MKEYNLTTEMFKAQNALEQRDRDEMVYTTFMGLVAAHRRGVYASDMKIRLSFYDEEMMKRCMDQMECDGVLALMRHDFGVSRVLCIELKQDNWGMF